MKILVVEDDRTILANIVEYLEARAHIVDVAHDGPAAIARLSSESFDVVVLDLGLPRADGMQVLRHLRCVLALATPVLVLTARDALSTKIECFDAGADDYLVKPFALAEVERRLTALHRRASRTVVNDTVRAGPLVLDRRTRAVHVGGAPLRLMPRSMQILELLLRDPGRMVSRAEIEAALWPHETPGGELLRSQIHLLRRALEQAGYNGLETVHGVGYRLRLDETMPACR